MVQCKNIVSKFKNGLTCQNTPTGITNEHFGEKGKSVAFFINNQRSSGKDINNILKFKIYWRHCFLIQHWNASDI
jgi:hypothetical protein